MNIDFRDIVTPGGFALAQTLHRTAGFANPMLAFEVTRTLVVPEMASLGTDKSLALILDALSPDTNNIHLDDFLVLASQPDAPKLTLGFGRADRAAILKRLSRLGEPESKPIFSDPKRDISHLPVNSKEAIEVRRLREKMEQGETFKRKTLFLLVRELQRLLYDNRGPVDLKMQNATYELPFFLVDGDCVQKSLYEVIDHFGSIGDLVRGGLSVAEAVTTRKTRQQIWANASLKEETH